VQRGSDARGGPAFPGGCSRLWRVWTFQRPHHPAKGADRHLLLSAGPGGCANQTAGHSGTTSSSAPLGRFVEVGAGLPRGGVGDGRDRGRPSAWSASAVTCGCGCRARGRISRIHGGSSSRVRVEALAAWASMAMCSRKTRLVRHGAGEGSTAVPVPHPRTAEASFARRSSAGCRICRSRGGAAQRSPTRRTTFSSPVSSPITAGRRAKRAGWTRPRSCGSMSVQAPPHGPQPVRHVPAESCWGGGPEPFRPSSGDELPGRADRSSQQARHGRGHTNVLHHLLASLGHPRRR